MTRSLYYSRREPTGDWTDAANWTDPSGLASSPRDVAMAATLNLAHFVGVGAGGVLWHRTVDQNDAQSSFADVTSQAGSVGRFMAVAIDTVGDDLHVLATTEQGVLWHTIRRGDGGWEPFGNVLLAAGAIPSVSDVSCSFIGMDLHIVAADNTGVVRHTVRLSDGNWLPWGNVSSETEAVLSGALRVSCAAIGRDLHVCVATSHGHLGHTARIPSGSWTKMGNVKNECGHIGFLVDVDCTSIHGDLHLVCSEPSGSVAHTIRRADGYWRPFGSVTEETHLPAVGIMYVACHAINSTLHVLVASDKEIYDCMCEASAIQMLMSDDTQEEVARRCQQKAAYAGAGALIMGLLSRNPVVGGLGGAIAAVGVLVNDVDCRKTRADAADRTRERSELIERINRNDLEIDRLREKSRTA